MFFGATHAVRPDYDLSGKWDFMEEGTQLAREVRRVPDSLCLQQMTAFVAHNDLQSSPDCEPKSWDERIPKANAVYVLASSADNDVAARLVARQEAIEN